MRSTSSRTSPRSRSGRWRTRRGSPPRTATPPASTRSRSTPAPSTPRPRSRSATATRRSRTRRSATRSASRSTASASSRRPTRAPASPATRSSRRSTRLPLGPARGGRGHLRPRQGRRAARRGRLRSGPPTASALCPTAATSAPCGCSRAARAPSRRRSWTSSRSGSASSASTPRSTVMESNKLTNVILDGEFDAFEWGWYVEPDPDSMLGYLTCEQRGGWNGLVVLRRGVRRALRAAELRDRRRERARTWSSRCRSILYDDAPYLVTAYSSIGEAFRSDRFACFQPQPDPGGVLLVPVRRPQLPQHPAGGRGRRLRRRGVRARCRAGTRRR